MNEEQKLLAICVMGTAKILVQQYAEKLSTKGRRKEKCSLIFLARSARQFQAIVGLIEHGLRHDACILLRSLLERYLYFWHLSDKNEFELFDDWCYKERYEHLIRIKGIPELKGKKAFESWTMDESQKSRCEAIKDDPKVSQWKRPKVKEICKHLKMIGLYHVCYDWGSGFVHPSTQQGDADVWALHGWDAGHDPNDDNFILNNSILVISMHMQHFMNQPEFNWDEALYGLIKAFPKVANGEQPSCEELFESILNRHESQETLFDPANTSVS